MAASVIPGVHASGGPPPAATDAYSGTDNGRRAGAGLVIPAVAGERSRVRSTAPPELGIPGTVLDAYRGTAVELAATRPGCHLTWQMLAGVGKIESRHAGN
ncbi:MAG TPA: hypothetical protein VE287_11490, partial [Actinopolymorphaceae bacterium]|nr:hypothetical protein [Actinopolymorphaceae bacterium]